GGADAGRRGAGELAATGAAEAERSALSARGDQGREKAGTGEKEPGKVHGAPHDERWESGAMIGDRSPPAAWSPSRASTSRRPCARCSARQGVPTRTTRLRLYPFSRGCCL